MISKDILILDCTLRDGGHALEEISQRNIGSEFFDFRRKDIIIKNLIRSRVNIVELGSIADGKYTHDQFSVYRGIEDVCSHHEQILKSSEKHAVIYRDPHLYNSFIPEWKPGIPKISRVIMRYFDLPRSYDFCRLLAEKGYIVFIQPMATVQYSSEQLVSLAKLANEITAGALYIVDTYGSMQAIDIKNIFSIFNSELSDSVRIGLHAHDNLNLALSNSIEFLSFVNGRSPWNIMDRNGERIKPV